MIPIKSPQQIETIRQSGKILAEVLSLLIKQVTPGVGTKEINTLAEQEFKKRNSWPAFKGYQGFPTAICACINDEVVHASAIPNRILKEGDIFSIDIGVRYPAKKGMITDMTVTLPVGKISPKTAKLVKVTQECLELAIQKIKPGAYLGDISHAIQTHAEKNKYGVVRELVGHGVGEKLHEPPQIPNFGQPNTGPILQPGMVLAIEPMITAGSYDIIYDSKTHAYKTDDGSLSAHFEHTVLVTKDGSEILTDL